MFPREAYNLAEATAFDVSHYLEKRNVWLRNGLEEQQVDQLILHEIKSGNSYPGDYTTPGDYHQNRSIKKEDLERCNSNEGNLMPDASSDVKRVDDNLISSRGSRSCSPPIDSKPIKQEFNYSAGRDVGVDQYDRPLMRKSNEKNHQMQDFENVTTSSPPSDLKCMMKQEICHSTVIPNFKSLQTSTSTSLSSSSPAGFNFRKRLNSIQCTTRHDGFQNNTNFFEPFNMMVSATSSDYGNQATKPNGVSLVDHDTTLYRSSRSMNDHHDDTAYASQWKGSINVPSHNKPQSQGYWVWADKSIKIPAFKDNHNARNSNIPPLVEDTKELNKNTPAQHQLPTPGYWVVVDKSKKTKSLSIIPPLIEDTKEVNKNTPSVLLTTPPPPPPQHQLPTSGYWVVADKSKKTNTLSKGNRNSQSKGYWMGAGISTNIPPLKSYQNAPSHDNQLQDYVSNSNSLPLPLPQKPFSHWPQPPETSELFLTEQRKIENRNAFREKQKMKIKNRRKGRALRDQQDPYKRATSFVPLIPCGLKIPPVELSKATPQEYWSQWWPRYKYVDKLLQKKSVSLKLDDILPPPRKDVLLKYGIRKILQSLDFSEKDYYYRDSFKLFKYKKQLEQPDFLNSLEDFELKRVQAALAQLQTKRNMALLHQSIIHKWHFSLDIVKRAQAGELIKSRNAFYHLTDKIFDFFVRESIKQLKEICKAEWPEFENFYKSIDTSNNITDISTLILILNSYKTENKLLANDNVAGRLRRQW